MIKKAILFFVLSLIIALGSACAANPAAIGTLESPSATTSDIIPDIPLPPGVASPSASTSDKQSPPPSNSSIVKPYDPSIFVIQASGKWRQELAEGYYADYECDIYLHKIDANDNRAVAGTYQGVFWMKTTINAGEYMDELLKIVPVKMDFNAGGEALSDNFGIYLNTTDDKAWVDYKILDGQDNPLPLTQDTPVAKGSFVAVAKEVYLKDEGSGAQGTKIDCSKVSKDQQIDMNYIVHVQPDSMESNGLRKVVFLISNSSGVSATVEGTMRRLPGYPEDVSDYLNSKEYQEASQKHFEE